MLSLLPLSFPFMLARSCRGTGFICLPNFMFQSGICITKAIDVVIYQYCIHCTAKIAECFICLPIDVQRNELSVEELPCGLFERDAMALHLATDPIVERLGLLGTEGLSVNIRLASIE